MLPEGPYRRRVRVVRYEQGKGGGSARESNYNIENGDSSCFTPSRSYFEIAVE